jgi:8-oxo-dGTP diphosphatase
MQIASGCLFVNEANKVLLVKPSYKPPWEIPGGAVEIGESPLAACIREVREELTYECSPQRLLSVDYRPAPEGRVIDGIRFVFFGGTLVDDQTSRFVLDPSELTEWRFVSLLEVDDYVIPALARRIRSSLNSSETVYLENGEPVLKT